MSRDVPRRCWTVSDFALAADEAAERQWDVGAQQRSDKGLRRRLKGELALHGAHSRLLGVTPHAV
jgi:hypothetical protein